MHMAGRSNPKNSLCLCSMHVTSGTSDAVYKTAQLYLYQQTQGELMALTFHHSVSKVVTRYSKL